ncbi:MAG TPA: ribulose-phosphate 3-epimerase [Pirellulaceae bacterium]|nr:ribulose-phosphate 3-epimerase [Pirellulaceae bacterium]
MSRRERIRNLGVSRPVILPSLLMCDFGNLEREIRALEEAGVRALHLDVMDGVFVPNLSYGMPIVEAIRRLTDLPLDVHLMITDPGRYLQAFVDAGADLISFHAEAVADPAPLLDRLRAADVGSGIVINPGTPLESVTGLLDACDLLLVMSVNAGFGGQAFDPIALDKLRRAAATADRSLILEVDGGVNSETIGDCVRAGARWLVVGSAIFRRDDYAAALQSLQELARDGLTA